MTSRAALFLSLVSLLGAGCGPTVKGVCDSLDDECVDYIPLEECEAAGQRLEDLADAQGCERGFEDYLDCIDSQVCDWRDECLEIRVALDVCLGGPEL